MLQNKHSVLCSNKEIIMKSCKGHDNSGMSTLWLYCDMARIGITPRQIPLKLKWKDFSEMGPYRGRKIGDNWCMMPGYDGRYGMDGNSWLRWMCDDRSVRYGMLVIKSGPYFCMWTGYSSIGILITRRKLIRICVLYQIGIPAPKVLHS